MNVTAKTLIKMGRWKLLLISCKEGETEIKVDKKQYERLRQTIWRENHWYNNEHIYDARRKYNTDLAVIIKTRRTNDGESAK